MIKMVIISHIFTMRKSCRSATIKVYIQWSNSICVRNVCHRYLMICFHNSLNRCKKNSRGNQAITRRVYCDTGLLNLPTQCVLVL